MRAEFRTGEAPVGGASVLRTAPPRYAAMTFSGDRSCEREGKQGAFRRRKSALPGVRRVDSGTTSPLTARSRRTQTTGVGEKPHRRRAVYLPAMKTPLLMLIRHAPWETGAIATRRREASSLRPPNADNLTGRRARSGRRRHPVPGAGHSRLQPGVRGRFLDSLIVSGA